MSEQATTAAPVNVHNFYEHRRVVDFRTSAPIVDFEPVEVCNRETKRNFAAQMRDVDGVPFTLNLFGFSNFTKAFGIQGTQAMRATPGFLNDTIKSIARRRDVSTALAVGETNHVFTQDEHGVDVAAELVNKYELRRYSDTKSSSLTLSREPFTPTGHSSDVHYIDAIVTTNVTFGAVGFTTYTELLRQICTNGMTRTISASNKKNSYSAEWIPKAMENTKLYAQDMKDAVDVMNSSVVRDPKGLIESVRVCIPAWVGDTAEMLVGLSKSNDLTQQEQEEMCPFGIKTTWDYINVCTWAMHRIKDIGSKQRLQERLYNYTFRKEWINSLKEAAVVA